MKITGKEVLNELRLCSKLDSQKTSLASVPLNVASWRVEDPSDISS